MAKPLRLTPEVLAELLAVHAQCPLDQQHKCPLLIFSAPLAWEINRFCALANDEDRGFKGRDEMLAARPLRPQRFDRENQG